jgi:hypothetical protein
VPRISAVPITLLLLMTLIFLFAFNRLMVRLKNQPHHRLSNTWN